MSESNIDSETNEEVVIIIKMLMNHLNLRIDYLLR